MQFIWCGSETSTNAYLRTCSILSALHKDSNNTESYVVKQVGSCSCFTPITLASSNAYAIRHVSIGRLYTLDASIVYTFECCLINWFIINFIVLKFNWTKISSSSKWNLLQFQIPNICFRFHINYASYEHFFPYELHLYLNPNNNRIFSRCSHSFCLAFACPKYVCKYTSQNGVYCGGNNFNIETIMNCMVMAHGSWIVRSDMFLPLLPYIMIAKTKPKHKQVSVSREREIGREWESAHWIHFTFAKWRRSGIIFGHRPKCKI